jgi:hypothetical protein
MWQIAFVTVGHLLILALALLGLRFLHRYTASRFVHCGVHCPTQLAAKGQYEAPPRGWMVLRLIVVEKMRVRETLLKGPLGFGAAPLGNMFRDIPDVEASATVEAAWEQGTRVRLSA